MAKKKPANKQTTRQANKPTTLRGRIHQVIFEAETPAGWIFDVILLIAILASVIAVCLETVESLEPVSYTHLTLPTKA